MRIQEIRDQVAAEDRREGPFEPTSPDADSPVDEQGADPGERHEGDQQAVRLELERKTARQRVAPHRDEQDAEYD